MEHLAPLGLQQELARRARAAPAHGDPDESCRLAVIEVPRDVRVAPSARERGVLSERRAFEAIGRALAVALTSALDPIVGRPRRGTVGRLIAALFAGLYTEPRFVERALGSSKREARLVRELAAAQTLIEVRTEAARACLPPVLSGVAS